MNATSSPALPANVLLRTSSSVMTSFTQNAGSGVPSAGIADTVRTMLRLLDPHTRVAGEYFDGRAHFITQRQTVVIDIHSDKPVEGHDVGSTAIPGAVLHRSRPLRHRDL